MNTRNAVNHLEVAIENLKRAAGFRDDVDPVFAKFDEAFAELRKLDPTATESPGRRESIAAAAEAPPPEPVVKDEKEPTVAQTFEQASSLAKERLSAAE